jgi:sulfate adenylyltransferase subunit 1 (EFTu-like GTPase family)
MDKLFLLLLMFLFSFNVAQKQRTGVASYRGADHYTYENTKPLIMGQHWENRTTGSIILVDDATNETVAAGMVV